MGLTTLNPERYGALCADVLPAVIEDDADLDRLTRKLEELCFQSARTPEETALANLLTRLIEDYEDRQHPIPEAPPRELLLFLMDQHGLRQSDLLDVFGSRGVASDVCAGKRSISKSLARKLAERFHVPADLFI